MISMDRDKIEIERDELIKLLRSHYNFLTENDIEDKDDWDLIERWERRLGGSFMFNTL